MPTPAPATTSSRQHQRTRTTPASAGLPDPRPVTDFTAEMVEVAGHSQLNVTLEAPCIIRAPSWGVIDVRTGERFTPPEGGFKMDSPTEFSLGFELLLPSTVCIVDVPYQDMQVQNYHGGFVRAGGKLFRLAA